MRQADIDQLKNTAYATKLNPGKIRELGEHVQVWAACLHGTHERRTDKFLTLQGVALTNGKTEIFIEPSELPLPDKKRTQLRGVPVADFAKLVWAKIPNLTQKSRVIIVVYDSAQNYGPLDVHDLDERITYTPAGNGAYALKYREAEKTPPNIEFIDAQAFFPDVELNTTLQNLKLAGADFDLMPALAADRAAVASWIKQQARNTLAVWRALAGTLEREYGINAAVYRTPAACAARVYVSQYLKESPAPKGVLKAVRLQAMQSYWGGRAEAFARGHIRGDINIYDAVSLYPNAAIALGEMPRANSWYRLTNSTLHTCRGGICTVEFEFPSDEIHPCLPVNTTGSLIYPLRGTSHCTVHEVRHALEIGAKIKILSGYAYSHGDNTLAQYSRDLLERKNTADDAGDIAGRTLYKLLLNSLYGKFGQHRVGYDLNTLRMVCRLMKLPSLDVLEKITNWETMAGDMLAGGEGEPLEPEIMLGGQWCPEWAALIQGYARMVESRAMRDYVALAGTTDSVILSADAGDEFYIEGVKFKRETRGNHLAIVRSRLYVLADGEDIKKAALHGAPNVSQMPAALLNWANASEIKIKAARARKLREGLTSGNTVGKTSEVLHTVSLEWDNKRVLHADYSTPHEFIDGDVSLEIPSTLVQ